MKQDITKDLEQMDKICRETAKEGSEIIMDTIKKLLKLADKHEVDRNMMVDNACDTIKMFATIMDFRYYPVN